MTLYQTQPESETSDRHVWTPRRCKWNLATTCQARLIQFEAGIPFSMKKVAQEMEKQYLCRLSPFDEEAWEKEEAEESQLEIS